MRYNKIHFIVCVSVILSFYRIDFVESAGSPRYQSVSKSEVQKTLISDKRNMHGSFEWKVLVEWLRGSESMRNMKLLQDFTYIDAYGKKWVAPKGFETDGASIPKVFWSLVGGPFEGAYREAAVIHDWYCDSKTEPWKDVHRIFYYANLAAGVSEFKSKLLYSAVLAGGPKWGDNSSNCSKNCHIKPKTYTLDKNNRLVNIPQLTEEDANTIDKWLKEKDRSLDEIDEYIKIKFPGSKFGH